MKRWRALSGEKKVFYLLTPGLPLAAVLILLAVNGFRHAARTLSRGWFPLSLLAPGFLLGTVNRLLVLAGRQPEDMDAWHLSMAITLLPSLFLVGFELLLLFGAAVVYFFGGPSWW